MINGPTCAGIFHSISAIHYVSTSGAVTGTVIQNFDPTCGDLGIVVENDDAWPVNVELANNVIRNLDPYGTAIEVTSGPSSSRIGIQIHDNLVSNVGEALSSSTNGNGVWVYGNSLQTDPFQSDTVVLGDAAVVDHNDITVSNNAVGSNPAAIAVTGNNAVITGNNITVDGTPATGIRVTGNHVKVWSNKITGNAAGSGGLAFAMAIGTTSASADVEWNSIDDFTFGIEMSCKSATVVSNTILDSTTGISDVPAGSSLSNNFVNDTTLQSPCP